jgi:exodeoxyribonuclease V gamma subunit
MAARLRAQLEGAEPRGWDLNLPLAGGVSLSGRLRNLFPVGNLVYTTDSFHPYQFLRYWIEHLALNLAKPPAIVPETHLLEGERRGLYHPPAEAEAHLASLVDLYQLGHERPLPFYPATAWAYLEGLARGGEEQAMANARSKWYGNRYLGGDASKPYNRLLWPDGDCFTAEFGELAQTVLRPLWDHLEWR